jgi:hypothetical protein
MSKNKNKQHSNPVAPAAPKKPADDASGDLGPEETDAGVEPEVEEDDWDDDAEVVPDPGETEVDVYVGADGVEIPVVCRNCEMWGKPHAFLGNKVMCAAGKPVKVMINDAEVERPMAEDIWSCSSYFVPKGMDITSSVPASPGEAAAMLKAAKWLKTNVEMQHKGAKILARYNEPVAGWLDRMDALSNVIESPDTYRFVFPLLQLLSDTIIERHRKTRNLGGGRSTQKYQKGDTVRWTDPATGSKMTGWIMTIALKNSQITVFLDQKSAAVVQPGTVGPLQVCYDYRTWRGYNPEVVQQSAVVMVAGPTPETEEV